MIRRALAWSFLAQFVNFSILFFGSVVLARLLTPREMGIYAVSLATMGILQIIAAFGIGNYVVRAVQLDARTLDTAFTVNAALNVILAATIFLLSFAGGRFLADPGVGEVMRLLALSPIISLFEFRPATMLQREMQFKRLSIVMTTQALVGLGVTIGSALRGASHMSPALGAIASALVGAIGYMLVGRQHVSLRMSRTGWRPIGSFGLRMMSIGGISTMASRVGDIVLGHFVGLAALGLFARANNLSTMIFSNLYGTATRVIFARMSAIYRETGDLRTAYVQGLRFIAAVLGPILIGFAVLSGPIIHLLYGEKWLGAAIPLSLLMIAQFISLRFAMNWELFVIRDELKTQTRIEITRSVFSLVSRTIGSLVSITAAAAAAVVDAIFSIVLYRNHVTRLSNASGQELTHITYEALLITGAAVLPSLALMVVTDWNAQVSLPLLASCIALGAILWLSALAWRQHPLFGEIKRMLKLTQRWFTATPA